MSFLLWMRCEADWVGGFRTPKAYECDIRPRNEMALQLLADSEFLSVP